MPILRIEVNEYQCVHCGYKWINRFNGKDGPVPDRCAKCKKTNWDQGSFTPEEVGLHRRIRGLGDFYLSVRWHWSDQSVEDLWDQKLVEQFLSLYPRPTRSELVEVFGPSDYMLSVDSQQKHRGRGWIEHPEKPGWAKYDPEAYIKIVKSEAEKRKELMRKAISARGLEVVDASPDYIPTFHTSGDIKLADKLLEMGKILEKAGTVPKEKICARLVKDLSSILLHEEKIERLCPAEWKQPQFKK